MKPYLFLSMLVLAFCLSVSTEAASPLPLKSTHQRAALERNILAGLQNPTMEVRASTMQLIVDLREADPTLDLNFAIIPLMDQLKSSDYAELRILSALALNSFDSQVGRFAVARRALYDPSTRVSKICAAITNSWMPDPRSTEPRMRISKAVAER